MSCLSSLVSEDIYRRIVKLMRTRVEEKKERCDGTFGTFVLVQLQKKNVGHVGLFPAAVWLTGFGVVECWRELLTGRTRPG